MVGPLDGGRKPEGQQGEHATSAQKGTSQFQTKDLLAVTVLTTTPHIGGCDWMEIKDTT